MTTTYELSAVSFKRGGKAIYTGWIKHYENGRFLFDEGTGVFRTTREDALKDAAILAAETLDS